MLTAYVGTSASPRYGTVVVTVEDGAPVVRPVRLRYDAVSERTE